MTVKSLFLATAMLLSATAVSAAETEIRVDYANPNIWTDTQQALAKTFMHQHPDIKITLNGPADTYADGVQRLLRDAVAGNLPDVAYVGLNRWQVLEARGLTQPLDAVLGKDPAKRGFTPALLSLGLHKGKQDALATSASTLVMYVNPTLVKRAGGSMENFPTTFDGVIALAAKINALGKTIDGIYIQPHDWRYQALLGSFGGRPMNAAETDITLDSPEAIQAAGLYQRFAKEAGMKSYGAQEARQALAAGTLGIMFESSSLLTSFEKGVGDKFALTVKPVPIAAKDPERVYFPTGGSGIVLLTKDKAKQAAAAQYIAFVTSPEGQKIIVETTGYAPANALVIKDTKYLGAFYKANPNAKVAHAQIAAHAGPWYSYPGTEGVAATDLVAAALVEITEGANPADTMKTLSADLRVKLNLKQ